MTDEREIRERQRLYERTREELAANTRVNAEAYDRALLTLSSAFLGGSLAFTGEVITLSEATKKWMLYLSWALFALAVVLTVISLMYGVLSFRWLSHANERFYVHGEQEAWNVSDSTQRTVLRFVWVCGVSFIGGIVLLVLFIAINLPREPSMSQKPTTPRREENSVPPPTFQRPSNPQPVTPPLVPPKGSQTKAK